MRIILDERREVGDRAHIVGSLELIERGVVRALLRGRIADGTLRWRSHTGRRRSVSCSRRIGWRRFGGRRGCLELAQSRIEIDVQIALALLRLFELVGDHFHLSPQTRDIGLDLLDLIEEVDQPAALELGLERRNPVFELPLDLRQARAGFVDPPARLVVIEKRRMRERGGEQQCRDNDTHPLPHAEEGDDDCRHRHSPA